MNRARSAKRKGFPVNLYLDTNGYFSYRNPQNGKRKGMGRDKASAFREARQANAALAAMTPSSLTEWVSGVAQHSLAQWIPLYEAKWVESAKPAASTLRMAASYLSRITAASFAWMSLKNITTAHIASFIDDVVKNSGAGAATNLRTRLSDVFRMAETQGLIDAGKNPVTSTYVPDREVQRDRLSLEQYLLVRAQGPSWLANAMDLALMTAQRREDIALAKFTDLRDGYLFVVQGKSQGKVRLQQSVTIRLDAVGMSIGDAVKQCRDNVISPFMVHHTLNVAKVKPGDKVAVNGISNAFKNAMLSAGIVATAGRTPASFHEIRSLSERLYKMQYGADFAQAMLGHKTASMTAKYDDLRGSGWQIIEAAK